jgi:hypothetical protein
MGVWVVVVVVVVVVAGLLLQLLLWWEESGGVITRQKRWCVSRRLEREGGGWWGTGEQLVKGERIEQGPTCFITRFVMLDVRGCLWWIVRNRIEWDGVLQARGGWGMWVSYVLGGSCGRTSWRTKERRGRDVSSSEDVRDDGWWGSGDWIRDLKEKKESRRKQIKMFEETEMREKKNFAWSTKSIELITKWNNSTWDREKEN